MQIFIVNSDYIKGRLDCYYYQPSFTELEEKISKLTDKTLSDYIVNIARGATPDKDQIDKYYSDANSGIPFIRVQNLAPEGLDLSQVKYINNFTHDGILKRSQVHQGDLLIKITGVGRMAVSSVAPKDFTGNINQHIVVIKTKDRVSSDYLATFLNSDIGETLAKRRSTGGTRPALDYEALKSIPIVWKPQIVQIIQAAYKLKQQKEKEAQELLDSIDDYVLRELGITMPNEKNEMVFIINSNELENKRVDAYFHQPKFKQIQQLLASGKYRTEKILDIIQGDLVKGHLPTEEENGDIKVVQISNIDKNGIIDYINGITARDNIYNYNQMLNKDDLLIVLTGATIGKIGLFNIESKDFYLGGDLVKFKVKKNI